MATQVARHLDRDYLVRTLSRLARVPTAVPMGFDTLIEPDHPLLVEYVQNVLRPELVALGMYDLIDVPRNNLVVRIRGSLPGPTILVMNYTPTQHFNTMAEPFSGKVASAVGYGIDEPAVFGQGVSQNKSHQATMLAVLKLIRDAGVEVRGNLYWAINNEGRSTHACSDAILDVLEALGTKPDFGIVQLGTGLKISLGNRGRVDVNVHVKGEAAHSSQTQHRMSAIEGAAEVVVRLRSLRWPDAHPQLGERHANVYKIRYEPIAPHTYPSDAFLTVDRRLLPGDDPAAATDEIARAIGEIRPFSVTITQGVVMWPALVPESDPFVQRLRDAGVAAGGEPVATRHMQIAYDAGGPCRRGVPTVMYGTASGKGWPIADDFVLVSHVETEARVLANFLLSEMAV